MWKSRMSSMYLILQVLFIYVRLSRRTYTPITLLISSNLSRIIAAIAVSAVRLLGNANDTTSRTTPSISSLLAVLMASLAKIISPSMNHNRTPKHALRADQLDQLVTDRALRIALAVGLEVPEVSDVALAVGGRAVGLVVGVDWAELSVLLFSRYAWGGKGLTVGPGAGAAVGVVAEGVDVHAALSVGVVPGDVP